MNRVELFNHQNMTDMQLLHFTIAEIEVLKDLFDNYNYIEFDRRKSLIDQLIKEIKRRNLVIERSFLVKRIFF